MCTFPIKLLSMAEIAFIFDSSPFRQASLVRSWTLSTVKPIRRLFITMGMTMMKRKTMVLMMISFFPKVSAYSSSPTIIETDLTKVCGSGLKSSPWMRMKTKVKPSNVEKYRPRKRKTFLAI